MIFSIIGLVLAIIGLVLSLHVYKRSVKLAKELDGACIMRWINVDDMLPEVGVRVLAYSTYGIYPMMLGEIHSQQFWYDDDWDVYRTEGVTHWMPLPESPKEVEDAVR